MEAVTQLATVPPRALARPALDFTAEQRKMIRDSFANGASDSEFAVLMEVAKARNLNPLTRQIYFVKRWDGQKKCEVWSTQISIDGLRAVAERTGVYDGQSEPVYEYDKDGKLTKCTVHVYRKDWSAGRSAVGVAFFSEYAQTKRDGGLTSFWATKPHIMLAKCAEALAIRKAFPEDTSGLYVPEEMGEQPEPVRPAVEVLPPEGERSAPRQDAARNVEKAAEVLGGKVEKPSSAPAPHVLKLWGRLVKANKDNKALAQKQWDKAAAEVFGDAPIASSKWSVEDTKKVEAVLFPPDIPF